MRIRLKLVLAIAVARAAHTRSLLQAAIAGSGGARIR